jgi:multiple sugar transport system substrate-binding protein
MRTKKLVVLLLVIVMAALSLAGCSSSKTPDNAPSDTETTTATIVLSRWAGTNADVQKEIAKEYKDAKIVVDDIDYENLKQKQIQSMSASAEYDLIWVAEVWLPEYVANNWLLPLDDYVKKSGVDMNNYSAGITKINTINGKLYAMPDMLQGLILTYDKDWFNKEGQKLPTTVEELISVAKYFKEKGTGIAIPAKQGQAAMDVFSTILYSAGGDYFDENGNLNLLSEEVLYAADIYDQLCKYSMDGSAAWHHDQVAEAIRTGKAPFGFQVSGLSPLDLDPKESVIVDSVGYATIPGKKQVSGVVNTWAWAIAANSKNPDAAWEVIKWLTSESTEKAMALGVGHTSAYQALSKDSEVTAKMPFLPALLDQMANGKTQPTDTAASEMFDPIMAALSRIATTDDSPEEIMKELQSQLGHIKISKAQ